MGNFIGIGKCSKYYLYILGTVIFKTLNESLFSFNSIDTNVKLSLFGFIPYLSQHTLIKSLYRYLSFIFGGALFLYISNKDSSNKKEIKKEDSHKSLKLKPLIYNKARGSKSNAKEILKVCFSYVIQDEIMQIMYLLKFSGYDIWTFDMIFILLFMEKYFSITLYKHQKFSIFFIIITSTPLLIISSFFPLINNEELKDKNTFQIIKYMVNEYFVIVVLLAFIILSCLLSYARVNAKILMDYRYLSPYKVILYHGLVGSFSIIISLVVLSFTECQGDESKIKFYCIKDTFNFNNNKTTYYYDSIFIYFNEINSTLNKNKVNFYLEILLITPSYIIISFFEFTCEILIIHYLNPIFILIRDNFLYGILKLIFLLIEPGSIDNNQIIKFSILETAEFLALLGYSIYLEIIELRFCGLDKDLKKKIKERGIRDTIISKIEENNSKSDSLIDKEGNSNSNSVEKENSKQEDSQNSV